MTLATLYPPIAVATVFNVFAFALMWRGHQIEKRTGRAPWSLVLTILGYILILALIAYSRWHSSLYQPIDILASALVGEAMGGMVVFTLLGAFVFTRNQSWRHRWFPIVLSAFFCFLLIASLFRAA